MLTLIANGLSDREIAERLVLSPNTVPRHVANPALQAHLIGLARSIDRAYIPCGQRHNELRAT